jgi:hypothetical protein
MASPCAAFAVTLAMRLLGAAQPPTAAAAANMGMLLVKTAAQHASPVAGYTGTGHPMHLASATSAASAACMATRHPSVLSSSARPAASCESRCLSFHNILEVACHAWYMLSSVWLGHCYGQRVYQQRDQCLPTLLPTEAKCASTPVSKNAALLKAYERSTALVCHKTGQGLQS